jgi:hypothetical protein
MIGTEGRVGVTTEATAAAETEELTTTILFACIF